MFDSCLLFVTAVPTLIRCMIISFYFCGLYSFYWLCSMFDQFLVYFYSIMLSYI